MPLRNVMAENNFKMLKIQQCVANKLPRNRPYICNICFKHFETPSKLARHYLIHTGQKPFECDVCHKNFRQLVHLERHQLTHNLPFSCNICQRHFKNLKTFVKHQQLHNESYHNDVKVRRLLETKQEKPVYGMCNTFTADERRALHPCSKSDATYSTTKRRKNIHACTICGKMFPSQSKLDRHSLIHTGQRPFKCVLCSKSFRQSTHLKIHQLTHSEERPFQCCFCQKGFKIQSKLLKHKQIHTRNKTLQNLPLKVKSPESYLSIYGSSGEEYLNCDMLQCGFSDSSENIHTGHKMCPCDKCDKVFPSISKLQRHYLIHTGQRPFDCNVCGKSFRQSAHLKRHKLTHIEKIPYSRPERSDGLLYQCSVCCKHFRSPSKLERHYLIHAGQKPFECSVCGKTFRQAPHWKRHQLTHFKERPQE
ncbi:RIKEN cDNA 6430601A21, partial [Mus musculus]